MAEVFLAIKKLRNPDQRVAIWAHNWHIAHRAEEMLGSMYQVRNMGSHLAEQLDSDYSAIALIGYQVAVNWPGYHIGELPPTSVRNAVEYLLHFELGRPFLLVEPAFSGVDEPFLDPATRYWLSEFLMYPQDQYGALLFVDESPMMDSLLW